MKNNHILITGASTGIGKAIALLLESKGYHVFAGVRNEADAEKLRQYASNNLEPVILDVTDTNQINASYNYINKKCLNTGLMCIINNAGYMHSGTIEFAKDDEIRAQYNVNVFGLIKITQTYLPLLRCYVNKFKSSGRIINIGSVGGRMAAPFTGIYNSTKFAIAGLSEALRIELASSNIKVILIEPGSIISSLWEKSSTELENAINNLPEDSKKYYERPMKAMKRILINTEGRGISAEKVANAVLRSIESTNPRNRYLIGREAIIMAAMIKVLPERIRYNIALHLIK